MTSPFSRQLDVEVRRLHGQVRAGWADVARDADLRTRAGWLLVLRRIGPKRLLLGAGALGLLLFLLVPTGGSSNPLDGPAGAIDLFLKLGIVVALAYASLAMLKRYTVGATRSTSMLQVLDSTTLAPNRSVYVVRVGEKRLVLGVTQTTISTLAELESESSAPEACEPAPRDHVDDDLMLNVEVGPGRIELNGRASHPATDGTRAPDRPRRTVGYVVEPPYGSAAPRGRSGADPAE